MVAIARYVLLICVLTHTNVYAISSVYNFRIAQVTKRPMTEGGEFKKYSVLALLFNQYNATYNDARANYLGGLASFIYDFRPYFLRADFAVANIHAKNKSNETFTGTETDDLLFTAGRNFMFSDRKVVTLSGLFGIPTHQILRLQNPDFGFGQFGLGAQLDGSLPIANSAAFFYGTRYIRFFKRDAKDRLGETYRFNVGNVQDVLVALQNGWQHNTQGVEVGFTSRFQFGATICPDLDDVIERTNYLRSSIYAIYKTKFLIKQTENRILLNLSYGSDHRPKTFGNKYIITVWLAWSISF